MTIIEAAKLALDAMQDAAFDEEGYIMDPDLAEAHDDLRTAIESAEKQEPVAWANINKHGDITHTNNKRMPWSKTPLYITPPAQPAKQEPVAWFGLEPNDMPDGDNPMYDHDFFLKGMAWADAILRKKNTTPPAAQREPAPGYCKHCKQYTIEEPLPAAQREWVGLTDEERMDILLNLNWDKKLSHMDTALAIEAKLKENT
jgi:hypothetical protein